MKGEEARHHVAHQVSGDALRQMLPYLADPCHGAYFRGVVEDAIARYDREMRQARADRGAWAGGVLVLVAALGAVILAGLLT